MSDELLLFEEPLFCCLLPLSLTLTGPGCDRTACGEVRNARVTCRVLKREKLKRNLFAVTLAIQVTGLFKGSRVKGVRCVSLKLPFADHDTTVECRPVPGSLTSACICQQDRAECEACLTVLVCVVSPCPDDHRCMEKGRPRIKRILRTPARVHDCPACVEIKLDCP